ncbi:MAG: DUF2357 domain-containing protein [Pikeienuella sp.]|uniref:DUF2357 domain-containing protein n=1 Tax=Pikeienuella sp. TaxID=2831957 RepID=UPI0039199AD2
MSAAEIWTRPWAGFVRARRHALDGDAAPPDGYKGPLWLAGEGSSPVPVNGRPGYAAPVAGYGRGARTLGLLPLPAGVAPLLLPDGVRLFQTDAARKWRLGVEPETEEEKAAAALTARTRDVWDRIEDMQVSLADPKELWTGLRDRWLNDAERLPHMHLIVKQARALKHVIDALERAPRRVLRRTHRMLPVARVQEIDRRSMVWSARQPGETLAERAGDAQRLLAVAREESFDTLENRVLRAYAELGAAHARDYAARNRRRKASERGRRVAEFGLRLAGLARDLAAKGVRKAEADVAPNFVLLEDARYREIWSAWRDLLGNDSKEDDLWRWQARSWEEFAALAVIVALLTLPGARLLAAAPVRFREEQDRGLWIESANPMVTVHLPELKTVVEAQVRLERPGDWRCDLAACAWLRFERTDRPENPPRNVAIWPIWSPDGGLPRGEVREVATVVDLARRGAAGATTFSRAIVIRPAEAGGDADFQVEGRGVTVSLGTEGAALRDGLTTLGELLDETFRREAAF